MLTSQSQSPSHPGQPERLSPLDAAFLAVEDHDPNASVAMGLLVILTGSPPADYELTTWMGLAAPGRTPAPVVARMAAETVRALDNPATWAKMRQQGFEALPRLDPAAFAGFVEAEFVKWGSVIRSTGATTD